MPNQPAPHIAELCVNETIRFLCTVHSSEGAKSRHQAPRTPRSWEHAPQRLQRPSRTALAATSLWLPCACGRWLPERELCRSPRELHSTTEVTVCAGCIAHTQHGEEPFEGGGGVPPLPRVIRNPRLPPGTAPLPDSPGPLVPKTRDGEVTKAARSGAFLPAHEHRGKGFRPPPQPH